MNTAGSSSISQLILVVEGTAALGGHWPLLRSEYIDKLIRSFSGNELGSQRCSGANNEMALVVFNTHGPNSAGSVQRSPWTADFDIFLKWLSEINFCAGGFEDVAVAAGLADALMMLAPSRSVTQMAQGMDRQKHCLLIAASNPYPIATPVPRPPWHTSSQQDANSEFQTMQWLTDAETVAKAYAQYFVSLSVIVPRQLPKLRSVFNAGQHNPSTTNAVLKNIEHSHHLVLISDSLMDACSVLNCSGSASVNASTKLINIDSTSAAMHSVPLQPQTTAARHLSGREVDEEMTRYPHSPNRELVAGTMKMELPTSVASGLSHETFNSLLHGTSQGGPGQSSSICLSTQETELNTDAEHVEDNKSLVGNTSQQLCIVTASTTNISLVNNVSYFPFGSAAIFGASPIGLQTGNALVSTQDSNLLANRMSSTPMPTPRDIQVTGESGLTSAGLVRIGQVTNNVSQTSFGAGISSLEVRQPVSSVDTGISAAQGAFGQGQSVSRRVSGGMARGSKIGQSGEGMSQNVFASMGPVRISSTPGSSQFPKISLNQSVQLGNLQGLGVGNISATASQQPETTPAKYIKSNQNVQAYGQSGLTSFGAPVGTVGVGQVVPNVLQKSFGADFSSLGVGQPVSSINTGINSAQGMVGLGQFVPGRVYGGMATGSEIGQSGVGMSQNVLVSMKPCRISSGARTIIPQASLNQSVQLSNLQGLGVCDSSMGNDQFPSTALASQHPVIAQASYTKVWEGMLACPKQSTSVSICKLEAYRNITSPETISVDWPTSMQIRGLMSQEDMLKNCQGKKVDYMIFKPMSQNDFLVQLSENNLFAVIPLATQMLLLSSSDRQGLMIGMLLPKPEQLNQQQQKEQQGQQLLQPPLEQTQMQQSWLQQPLEQTQLQQSFLWPQQTKEPTPQHQTLEQTTLLQQLPQEPTPQQLPLEQTTLQPPLEQSWLQQPLEKTQLQQPLEQSQQQHSSIWIRMQEQQQPQGIPYIGYPISQSQPLQGQLQGDRHVSTTGTAAQQQQQQQQPQGIPSAIEQPFVQIQPPTQTSPQFISQGQLQSHVPTIPGEQTQGIPSAIAQPFAQRQPPNRTRSRNVLQRQFQGHHPPSRPGSCALS